MKKKEFTSERGEDNTVFENSVIGLIGMVNIYKEFTLYGYILRRDVRKNETFY